MHPCDAKGIFFSEVNVLRGSHTSSPRAAVRHVICVGVGDAADLGATGLVFCAHRMLVLLFYRYKPFFVVF